MPSQHTAGRATERCGEYGIANLAGFLLYIYTEPKITEFDGQVFVEEYDVFWLDITMYPSLVVLL
jgi:hypothetical protein